MSSLIHQKYHFIPPKHLIIHLSAVLVGSVVVLLQWLNRSAVVLSQWLVRTVVILSCNGSQLASESFLKEKMVRNP
jgi:hypothetical protein